MGIILPKDHSMIYCAMPYAIEGLLSFEKTLKKDAIVTEAKASLMRDKVTKVNLTLKLLKQKRAVKWVMGNLL